MTSPIWYRPEGIGALTGAIRFGDVAGTDVLTLKARIGKLPAGVDFKTQELALTLRDNDTIYTVTLPAGRLQQVSPGRYVHEDASGSLGGLKRFVWSVEAGTLELETVPTALSHADRSEHTVEFALSTGTFQTSYSRRWAYNSTPQGTTLSTM